MKPYYEIVSQIKDSIPGQTNEVKLFPLFFAAKFAPPGPFVEIGALAGRSAVCLATAGDRVVFSVDLFPNKGDWFQETQLSTPIPGKLYWRFKVGETQSPLDFAIPDGAKNEIFSMLYSDGDSALEAFKKNISKFRLLDIRPFKGTSAEFCYRYPTLMGTCGLVYVDGDHSKLGCLIDLVAAIRLLRPGGILIADDMDEKLYPGTSDALRIAAPGNFSDWEYISDKMIIARRYDPRANSEDFSQSC